MADTPVLATRGLSKRFGGIVALEDVNFSVQQGSIKALIGPNGAGKTTVFHIVTGLYLPTDGRILFEGHRVDRLPPHVVAKRGISRTFQNVQIFGHMSVLENVMVGCHIQTKGGMVDSILRTRRARRNENWARKQAWEKLEFVGLAARAEDVAMELTFHEQRLIEFARALATRPKLLLLDEPASGLNAREAREMAQLIRRIREQGITVLLVEHVMDLVMEISDEVAVLNSGVIIADGTPRQVQRDQRVIAAYLGQELSGAEDTESQELLR